MVTFSLGRCVEWNLCRVPDVILEVHWYFRELYRITSMTSTGHRFQSRQSVALLDSAFSGSNSAKFTPSLTELEYKTPSQPERLINSQRNWLGMYSTGAACGLTGRVNSAPSRSRKSISLRSAPMLSSSSNGEWRNQKFRIPEIDHVNIHRVDPKFCYRGCLARMGSDFCD